MSLFGSANRQERYEVRVDALGRVVRFRHDLRPEEKPSEVSMDSAAVLARRLLTAEAGLDLTRLETLPVSETITLRGHERGFGWHLRDSLPGGAAATASVSTAGPT